MSAGRHRRTAAGGTRKAAPAARRASPVRVGRAPVAGRRVAGSGGRPRALTALGSGEKLLALVPLTMLSAASVAGLVGVGGDAPDDVPSADPGPATTGTIDRTTPARSAPTPTLAAPTVERTESPQAAPSAPRHRAGPDGSLGGEVPPAPGRVPEQPDPTDGPTEPEEPSDPDVTTPPEPEESPTDDPSTPDAPETDAPTRLEATAQCLASGISQLDVVALAECVEDLLTP